jgi:hypothetical protein
VFKLVMTINTLKPVFRTLVEVEYIHTSYFSHPVSEMISPADLVCYGGGRNAGEFRDPFDMFARLG